MKKVTENIDEFQFPYSFHDFGSLSERRLHVWPNYLYAKFDDNYRGLAWILNTQRLSGAVCMKQKQKNKPLWGNTWFIHAQSFKEARQTFHEKGAWA